MGDMSVRRRRCMPKGRIAFLSKSSDPLRAFVFYGARRHEPYGRQGFPASAGEW